MCAMRQSADHFLPDPEELEQWKQWRYEESVVKRIVKKFRSVDEWKWPFLRERENLGEGLRIAFEDFQHKTDFPMWLATHRFPPKTRLSVLDVFRDWPTSAICRAWDEFAFERPWNLEHLPFGVVFPVPRIKFLVVHDRPVQDDHGSVIEIYTTGGAVLVIQPLDDLLNDLLGDIGPSLDGGSWEESDESIGR